MDVRKTVLVGHSAGRMFDVIEAAEHYPDFLPWCARAAIVARDAEEVVADLSVDYHGIRFGFRTRNPKRRPTWMAIHLERGPFRRFDGVWELTPLSADGCRVDFALHYDFDSTAMATLARPVFDRIASTLVDRFVARADALDAADRRAASSASSATSPPAPAPTTAEAGAAAPPTATSGPGFDPTGTRNDLIHRSDPS